MADREYQKRFRCLLDQTEGDGKPHAGAWRRVFGAENVRLSMNQPGYSRAKPARFNGLAWSDPCISLNGWKNALSSSYYEVVIRRRPTTGGVDANDWLRPVMPMCQVPLGPAQRIGYADDCRIMSWFYQGLKNP